MLYLALLQTIKFQSFFISSKGWNLSFCYKYHFTQVGHWFLTFSKQNYCIDCKHSCESQETTYWKQESTLSIQISIFFSNNKIKQK